MSSEGHHQEMGAAQNRHADNEARRAHAEKLKKDITFEHCFHGRKLVIHSTWGLFSPRGIDEGTKLLLDHITFGPNETVLDLGCGYGAIGIAVAAALELGVVHMVDKDFTALEYARKNAELNQISNCSIYPSNAFSEVNHTGFTSVFSNPPANAGKEMLFIMVSDAFDRLCPGGQLVVVTIAGLKSFIKRHFLQVFGNYEKIKQGRSHAVFRAVREVP